MTPDPTGTWSKMRKEFAVTEVTSFYQNFKICWVCTIMHLWSSVWFGLSDGPTKTKPETIKIDQALSIPLSAWHVYLKHTAVHQTSNKVITTANIYAWDIHVYTLDQWSHHSAMKPHPFYLKQVLVHDCSESESTFYTASWYNWWCY